MKNKILWIIVILLSVSFHSIAQSGYHYRGMFTQFWRICHPPGFRIGTCNPVNKQFIATFQSKDTSIKQENKKQLKK